MRSISSSFFLLAVAACGGGAADSAGGGDPGNVGFGGAQDIGEFRGILERGEIPGPNTLDANGFFNEHFNAPPADVSCGGPLCLTPGLSVGRDFLTGAHQATLQISVNTTVDPTLFPRLPMRLVVVVDHSGSMAEDNRLEKVKTGLHAMIDNLDPADRLSIISFDDTVTIDQPFTTELDRTRLHQVVDALRPDGATNIFGGLQAGMEMIGIPENEKQNRVIFLSDGLATAGNTDQNAIIEMATGYIARGVGLTTIGVGNDFDVNLMRGLAERGAGNFYFIEDASAATEVFTEELDVFMSPLALDLQITASTATGWQMREVTGTKLWQAGAQRGEMRVPAVFFASRTSQQGEVGRRGGGSMIFIRLDPTAAAAGKVSDITLSYRLPGTQEIVTHTVSLDYNQDPNSELADPHLSYPEMAERYAMYNMFLGFRVATTEASYGDYNCAVAALNATRTNAELWNSTHGNDPDIVADLQLLDMFVANLRAAGATGETTLSQCPLASDPSYPYGEDGNYYGDDYAYACSSGRSTTGWLLILAAFAFVVRRRRR